MESEPSTDQFFRERDDKTFRGETTESTAPPVSSTPLASYPAPNLNANQAPPRAGVPTPDASIDAQPGPTSMVAPTPSPAPRSPTARVWVRLEASLQGLHKATQIAPPIQSTVGLLITCLDLMQEISESHDKRGELAIELATTVNMMAKRLAQPGSARISDAVANFMRGIEEQLKTLENGRDRGARWRQPEPNAREEQLSRCYRRIGSLFRQIRADAQLSAWSSVNKQKEIAHQDRQDNQLDLLKPVQLAMYDSSLSTSISRRTCTTNTRTAILSGLNDWANDPSQVDVYWMNGVAGTGKTTIACTFAEALEERKQLAASFFCTRTTPECRAATLIIPTIAYQFAQYSMPFRSALCKSLQADPDTSSVNITKQFDQLLKQPLLKVRQAIPSNLVVVIDALDECNDMVEVELLLSVLLKNVASVPIRFFVTSRPEPELYARVQTRTHSRTALHLHEVEKSLVQADIQLYLEAELESISPTPAQVQELTQRSGALFIYAATLVRYIRSRNTRGRLESVLSASPKTTKQYAAIDALYAAILEAALKGENLEDGEAENIRQVLKTAICVQEPVSIRVLTELAGLSDEDQTRAALEPLRAVLHYPETTGLVSTLHASFPDFMFDESRSGVYSCGSASHNAQLVKRCFSWMKSKLEFNICNLESSLVPDSRVGDLEERVRQKISPNLWYACRYWGNHLKQTGYSDTLRKELDDFLSSQLLFWMEVMNLKDEMGVGAEILTKVKSWVPANDRSSGIGRRIEDCGKFAASFAGNPISESTPHIYISALPFCPKSSFVYRQYFAKARGLIGVTGSAMKETGLEVLANWKADSEVKSLAYSPDGSRIAHGCDDGTIFLRDAYNGTLVAVPLEGHTSWVMSLGYSPDGIRIVSGSRDHTVRVWNATDGTLVAGPFQGHTEPIWSVAFSPDSTRVVSGSCDNTIRVWDATNGTLVAGPFKGHTEWVLSVAYSPDGTRIVSGSGDNTIRVWDVTDGTLVAGPFEGHIGPVLSAAYSPDGTRIVSCSVDMNIRVWNATDGTLVAGPFEGHTKLVLSVAFSSDRTRIVSASEDCTIQVWSVTDGTLIAGPFEGHTKTVFSVAFSPDCTRIVSGSDDCIVQVWDAMGGTLVDDPLQGHGSVVYSVTYSPDGTRIASGSDDRTILVWDATDGTFVAGPFEGHTSSVNSVAYSPDGTRIVSGSHDKTIRVWDATDGTLVAGPFEGHTESVNSVAYSPDGTRIISGSQDKSIREWDATDGTLVAGPLEDSSYTEPNNSIAYSPDGTRIVTGFWNDIIRVWDANSGVSVAGLPEGYTNLVDPWPPATGDGWVMTPDSSLLFWIPHELRFASIPPNLRCRLFISPHGTVAYDYSNLAIGTRWAECFPA